MELGFSLGARHSEAASDVLQMETNWLKFHWLREVRKVALVCLSVCASLAGTHSHSHCVLLSTHKGLVNARPKWLQLASCAFTRSLGGTPKKSGAQVIQIATLCNPGEMFVRARRMRARERTYFVCSLATIPKHSHCWGPTSDRLPEQSPRRPVEPTTIEWWIRARVHLVQFDEMSPIVI